MRMIRSQYQAILRRAAMYDDPRDTDHDWERTTKDQRAVMNLALDLRDCRVALKKAMECEVCDGTGKLLYPPNCNCYGDPICTHQETEGECPCCEGTGLRDLPECKDALA
jgi:hypothetical protein